MILSDLQGRGLLKGVLSKGGGGGGVTDYSQLSGKPQINGVTIEGDHSGNYYSLMDTDDIDIIKITDLQRGNNYGITLFGTNYGIINMVFDQNESGLVPAYSAADAGKILSTNGWIDIPSNTINYSTTEQNTGQKWIDGKDIYIRVIEDTGSFTTSDYFGSYSGSISIDNSYTNVWIDRTMSYLITGGGVKEDFVFSQFNPSNHTLFLFTCASRSGVSYKLVIRYTK